MGGSPATTASSAWLSGDGWRLVGRPSPCSLRAQPLSKPAGQKAQATDLCKENSWCIPPDHTSSHQTLAPSARCLQPPLSALPHPSHSSPFLKTQAAQPLLAPQLRHTAPQFTLGSRGPNPNEPRLRTQAISTLLGPWLWAPDSLILLLKSQTIHRCGF